MKRKREGWILGLLLIAAVLIPSKADAQYDDVTYDDFYEELAPYGTWINDPEYGRVWRPDVDHGDFRPYYTNGRWEMTRYGNTWVSDYNWGWAPFHYGRWHHAGRRGWIWVPGLEWSPAWVSWRSGGGHYGWAPLGPGINININIGRIPDFYWVFVPQRHIYYRSFPRYDYRRTPKIYHNTVIINNTYVYNRSRYYTGPRAEEIRRVTRQPVVIREVRNARPERYAGRNTRSETINRAPDRSQAARPQRATESRVLNDNRNSVGSSAGRERNTSQRPSPSTRSYEPRERAPQTRVSDRSSSQDRARQASRPAPSPRVQTSQRSSGEGQSRSARSANPSSRGESRGRPARAQ